MSEEYTHPVYTYLPDWDTVPPTFMQMGPWSGGPVEDLQSSLNDRRIYLRFPNAAAAEAAQPTEDMDFRLATEEEVEALGELAPYAGPTE